MSDITSEFNACSCREECVQNLERIAELMGAIRTHQYEKREWLMKFDGGAQPEDIVLWRTLKEGER